MKTFVLDTVDKSITAVMSGAAATTNPDFTAAYADRTATNLTEGANDGTMNGTTPVTFVAAPAASTRRIVKSITIQNRDTAPVILTVRYVSAGGTRQIWSGTLAVNDTWTPEGVYDSNGNLKTLGGHAAWVSASAPTVNDDANDGFTIGSRWVDTTTKQMWVCVDATVGGAVWQNITSILYASDGSPTALTADAAGNLTAAAALTLGGTLSTGGNINMGSNNLRGGANTVDDDAAISITPGYEKGVIFLFARVGSSADIFALVGYGLTTAIWTAGYLLGANVEVTTGILTGTTGTDTKFTISYHTDGNIYLENRRGSTRYVAWVLFGASY